MSNVGAPPHVGSVSVDLKRMQPLNVEILDAGVTGLESYNDRMKGTKVPIQEL